MAHSEKPPYQPTAEQSARVEALKQRNRLTLYLPLLLLGLPIIAVMAALIWLSTAGNDATQWQGNVSGIADMVIILSVIPVMLMCAVLPVGAIALVVTGRQKEWQPIHSLRVLLWRSEGLLNQAQDRINQYAPPLIEKTIEGNRRFSYLFTIISRFTRLLFGPVQRTKNDQSQNN